MRFRVSLAALAVLVLFSSPALGDDIGAAARGVVRIIVVADEYDGPSVGFGSGFAISPHRIVTNAHVVEAARNSIADSVIAIVPAEGAKAVRGSIIAYDQTRDLAVIDIGDVRLEALTIYSGPVEAGEDTAALGYPGNVDLATVRSMSDLVRPTLPVRSEGNVSSERSVDGTPAFLHTAAISRGNSGGPLVDECGRVLGVNTYTTRSGSGDAPFGFAVVASELISFLRENGETFRQITTACLSMAELAQQEERARAAAAREEEDSKRRSATYEQAELEAARARLQDSRENHVAGAVLFVAFSIIAGAFSTALFVKDRTRAAAACGLLAASSVLGGAYAFFSRPTLELELPARPIHAAGAAVPLAGTLLCQVKPEASRITVSSTDDLALSWDANGCMNSRTQYVQDGGNWRRVLVPNGSETVFVQDFDPIKREYISRRYLLSHSDVERLRQIRAGNPVMSCTADPASIQQLRDVTETLVRSLPATPNEKLVYRCAKANRAAITPHNDGDIAAREARAPGGVQMSTANSTRDRSIQDDRSEIDEEDVDYSEGL